MNFSDALLHIKACSKLARRGWNGKDMYVFLVRECDYNYIWGPATIPLKKTPFIAMRMSDKSVMPWLAAQVDLLAEDWEIVYTF